MHCPIHAQYNCVRREKFCNHKNTKRMKDVLSEPFIRLLAFLDHSVHFTFLDGVRDSVPKMNFMPAFKSFSVSKQAI